ncbi:hypothetical protein BBJ28_00001297 [Nothophytophthora sp. Chile5]|nr:hypothetical protein BBJ28_00001297 [Nothophytophthora sp. Chile5]
MERAHVLIRLRDGEQNGAVSGICRTGPTTVRLEHSEMSPGVASITFEQVFDADDSNARVFQQSLASAVDSILDGRAVTLVVTGAPNSGKSFSCHGDQQKQSNRRGDPGLITLAIRRVFSEMETRHDARWSCNVLLSCWGVNDNDTDGHEALIDLLAVPAVAEKPQDDKENMLVGRSVVVSTPAEAIHLYSQALKRVRNAERQDFAFALHAETLAPDGEARCGRLVIVDIHGGSIIEPRGESVVNSELGGCNQQQHQYFSDTQFPVNKPLSAGFGQFLGNSSATYLLVAIQKSAPFQQQVRVAIDSAQMLLHLLTYLLFALLISAIGSAVVGAADHSRFEEEASHAAADALLKSVPRDDLRMMTLQTKLERIRASQLELERALARESSIKDKCVDRISRLSQTMSCQVVEHERQLQEALAAKHTAETQLQQTNSKFTDVGREVARLQEQVEVMKEEQRRGLCDDEGLEKDPSVVAGLESSKSERMMLHTLSSRLEEAMAEAQEVVKFKDGVIKALEERLQLASKRGAEAVALLEQEQVRFEADKTALLDQLQQSKDREARKNEEATKAQTESLLMQQQKAELTVKVAQLTLELETARSHWAQEAREHENRVEHQSAARMARAEQQHSQATAEWQQQMAQLNRELDMKVVRQRVATQAACKAGELQRVQLEHDLHRTKLKLAKQKLKLEKKMRVLVASAHKQQQEPVAALQDELEDLSVRLETVQQREREAVARARRGEEDVELLKAQMQQLESVNIELKDEVAALVRRWEALEADKRVLEDQLKHREQQTEQALAQQLVATEARVHAERDRQTRRLMEQHSAELVRLEVANSPGRGELQTQAQTTAELQHASPQHSSSSGSSRDSSSVADSSSSSGSHRQQSIDELDALIDSKERRFKRAKERKDRSSSSSSSTRASSSLKKALARKEEQIAELSTRLTQLLTALATANEQETLAKQQTQEAQAQREDELARYEQLLRQLNHVKQENWSLSLALHVTETTKQQHQQQRTGPRPSPIY